ncbi:MAG: hypothetical protein JSV44_05035 [Candidatus Zixiibacteriota bacterium]|nr:MAG: hypothetical protein JSV44_05035 [candidate division Zixibacteria bacterium]
MGRQRFTVETIVRKLREAEVDLSQGRTIAQVVKKLGVCEQTNYCCQRDMVIDPGHPNENHLRLLLARNFINDSDMEIGIAGQRKNIRK